MKTILKKTDREVRKSNPNPKPHYPKIARRRAFDVVAYAAALEVLG
jgi:hypothetical protein